MDFSTDAGLNCGPRYSPSSSRTYPATIFSQIMPSRTTPLVKDHKPDGPSKQENLTHPLASSTSRAKPLKNSAKPFTQSSRTNLVKYEKLFREAVDPAKRTFSPPCEYEQVPMSGKDFHRLKKILEDSSLGSDRRYLFLWKSNNYKLIKIMANVASCIDSHPFSGTHEPPWALSNGCLQVFMKILLPLSLEDMRSLPNSFHLQLHNGCLLQGVKS